MCCGCGGTSRGTPGVRRRIVCQTAAPRALQGLFRVGPASGENFYVGLGAGPEMVLAGIVPLALPRMFLGGPECRRREGWGGDLSDSLPWGASGTVRLWQARSVAGKIRGMTLSVPYERGALFLMREVPLHPLYPSSWTRARVVWSKVLWDTRCQVEKAAQGYRGTSCIRNTLPP